MLFAAHGIGFIRLDVDRRLRPRTMNAGEIAGEVRLLPRNHGLL